jgi:hypothetical protein
MFSDAHMKSGGRQLRAEERGVGAVAARGAPLTPAQFREHRLLAERSSVPLRVVLDAVVARRARP